MIFIHTNETGQTWATARAQLPTFDLDAATARRDELVIELRRQGFGVTGTSMCTCSVKFGDSFNGFEIVVDAVRGGRPSAIELTLQSTLTGRD